MMDDFTWHLRHPLSTIKEAHRKVQYFIQRGRRGYADCDAWNLHGYLSSWMPDALRQLRDGNAYPYPLTAKLWEEKLTTMIEGFEALQRQENLWEEGLAPWDEQAEWNRLDSKAQTGLREFINHFHNLWD